MKPIELIELEIKQTAGYHEALDKDSFMAGVSVALSKAEANYELEIKHLKIALENSNSYCETYKKDLKTISSIINRYSEPQ